MFHVQSDRIETPKVCLKQNIKTLLPNLVLYWAIMNGLPQLFERLWSDFLELNPDARSIRSAVENEGNKIVNDHIALRTFNDPRVNIDVLARIFVDNGYAEADSYEFPRKKLDARHFEHPDALLPRVFISELRVEKFSQGLQDKVEQLVNEVPTDLPGRDDFLMSGRPWDLAFSEYEDLRAESEYAAWMAAFGFRPNHFTILVNELETFPDLQSLTGFLREKG